MSGALTGTQIFQSVNLDTILRCYNPRKEPSVIQNKADVQEKTTELLACHDFVQPGTRVMTRKAWFDFCSDTSAAIVEDSHFHQVMSDPWEAVVVRLHHQNGVPSTIRPLGFHQAGFNAGHITSNGSMELLRLLKRIVGDSSWSDGALRQLFDQFDRDQDGYISPAELCTYFGRQNVRITTDEMTELLEIIDLDGDGFIGMNDFKSIVNSIDRRTAVINRDRLVKKVQSEKAVRRPTIKSENLNTISEPLTVLRKSNSHKAPLPIPGFWGFIARVSQCDAFSKSLGEQGTAFKGICRGRYRIERQFFASHFCSLPKPQCLPGQYSFLAVYECTGANFWRSPEAHSSTRVQEA